MNLGMCGYRWHAVLMVWPMQTTDTAPSSAEEQPPRVIGLELPRLRLKLDAWAFRGESRGSGAGVTRFRGRHSRARATSDLS